MSFSYTGNQSEQRSTEVEINQSPNDEIGLVDYNSDRARGREPSVMPGLERNSDDDECKNLVESKLSPGGSYPRPACTLANGLPARWQLALLSMFGFMFLYALRFNISQALLAMTGNNFTYCDANRTPAVPEFNWTKSEQGVIQSSFFYGYTVMSLPGGWVCGIFGSKRVIFVSMLINAILCLLTPLVATAGVPYLIVLRVVQGLTQAPFYPAMHRMWGKWAPQADVGALSSVSYSGPYVGNILSYLVGGILSERGFGAHAGQTYCGADWPSIFYVFGAATFVWLVFWAFLAYDTPDLHPRISHCERTYIVKNLAHNSADPDDREDDSPYSLIDLFPFASCVLPHRYVVNTRIPWRAILTSVPVWALCFNLLTFDYGMYTLMTNVPQYLHDVQHFDLTASGILTALPFLMMWLMTLLAGGVTGLDWVRNNVSFNVQRKGLTLIGSIIPAGLLIGAGYAESSTVVVVLITLSTGISGCQMIGAGINQIDLAPRYADVLMGFSNTFAAMGGIVAPYLASVLTPNGSSKEWRLVFFITSGLFVLGAIVFTIFGSAERQWWAYGKEKKSQAALPVHLDCDTGRSTDRDPLVRNMSDTETIQYAM